MPKKFTSVGLMSGTSCDGVDASIIISDGYDFYEVIKNKFYDYDNEIFDQFHSLRDKIKNLKDIDINSDEMKLLEKKITLFHAKTVENISKGFKIDLVGFHGQTIYHNALEKTSIQLGDAKLLSQLTKKNIIFNFRANDIKNGGEGAPLTPIFHRLLVSQNKIKMPCCIMNIGGITNITLIENLKDEGIFSRDIGPGNCLIDQWVRNNTDKKFDEDGRFANAGSTNDIILEQVQDLIDSKLGNKKSLDVNDFDISFIRGLSLEDGAATLTSLTGSIVGSSIISFLQNKEKCRILICGGGRKNHFLIKKIKKFLEKKFQIDLIEKINIDGDFVESQAFAYMAIRSFLKLPISFPKTTGCIMPCTGGEIILY